MAALVEGGFSATGEPSRERRAQRRHGPRNGKVVFSRAGYGFITPDEGGEDLFVHYTGIAGSGFRSLEEGDRVSYEPARGRKGEQAENVRKV